MIEANLVLAVVLLVERLPKNVVDAVVLFEDILEAVFTSINLSRRFDWCDVII